MEYWLNMASHFFEDCISVTIRKNSYKNIVEIGVDLGGNTVKLIDLAKELKANLYCIDPDTQWRPETEYKGAFFIKKISLEGLEDFYHLVQILKRNRDVISTTLRSLKNLRPLDKFKFVEEDIAAAPAPKTETKKKTPKTTEPEIDEEELSQVSIEEEVSNAQS
jgi:hypothetical protein